MSLNAEDRANGNLALGYWYNGGFKPYTLDEARAYYDSLDPNFISQLGHSTGAIEQSRVRDALTALALQDGANYPSQGDFYGALVSAGVTAPSFGDVAQAAAQGVSQFGSGLLNIGEILVPIAILGLGIFYWKPIFATLKRMKLA